jgi:sortase (surface protein transpeptidase)
LTRKRLSTILILAGSATLIWCATVWTSAALFERYQAWRWAARSADAPAIRVAPRPHDVIAWIEVPRLGISTAVLAGDDDLALRLGAGHIPGTPLPGGAGNVALPRIATRSSAR